MEEASTVGENGPPTAEENGEGASPEHPVAAPPMDASILWTPVKMGLGGARVSVSTDVYLTSQALRDIETHVLSGDDPERWGLLVGEVCRSPEGEPWVVGREAWPSSSPLPEEADVRTTVAAISRRIESARAEGATVVGWYHSHTRLGAFLSERDAKAHGACFPEPWQFAVVGLADLARPAGGVFGRSEWGALLRGVYLPFRELVEEGSVLADGRRVTCLEWVNYSASEETVPEAVAEGLPRQAPRDEEAAPVAVGEGTAPSAGEVAAPAVEDDVAAPAVA
ncbi:MAG: Mov34/MPN/PAD-1 family protein, partial [Gemmatimonadota bacterium]